MWITSPYEPSFRGMGGCSLLYLWLLNSFMMSRKSLYTCGWLPNCIFTLSRYDKASSTYDDSNTSDPYKHIPVRWYDTEFIQLYTNMHVCVTYCERDSKRVSKQTIVQKIIIWTRYQPPKISEQKVSWRTHLQALKLLLRSVV